MSPTQLKGSKRYHRNMVDDKLLHEKLHDTMGKCITQEKLTDIAHGMDTNANESFNNTVSWYAPKNKVYSGSRSLWNRIGIAIGVQSVGYEVYYKRLFKKLGIQISPNTLHYLAVKQKQRQKRLQKQLEPSKKKSRNKRKFEALQARTLIAKKERLTRAGKHQTGMNVDVTAEEFESLPVRTIKPASVYKHPFCGLKGHVTTESKKCKANPKNPQRLGLEEACAAAISAAAAVQPQVDPIPFPFAAVSGNAATEDLDRHEAVCTALKAA